MGVDHYLNASFHLGLAKPFHPPENKNSLERMIAETSLQYWLAAKPGDRVLLDATPEDGFADEWCETFGIEWNLFPIGKWKNTFRPFAWSDTAIEHNLLYETSETHPGFDCIRWANSRLFSHSIRERYALSPLKKTACYTIEAENLDCLLASLQQGAWVIKCEHSNSAYGNRLAFAPLDAAKRKGLVEELLKLDSNFVIEPWLKRKKDYGFRFMLSPSGVPGPLDSYESICGGRGVFKGIVIPQDLGFSDSWRQKIEEVKQILAKELHEIGYFGPVQWDAFSFESETNVSPQSLNIELVKNASLTEKTDENKNMELWPLGEINARHTMASAYLDLFVTNSAQQNRRGSLACLLMDAKELQGDLLKETPFAQSFRISEQDNAKALRLELEIFLNGAYGSQKTTDQKKSAFFCSPGMYTWQGQSWKAKKRSVLFFLPSVPGPNLM